MTMQRCRCSSGRNSMSSSARQLAKIETERGSPCFQRLPGSMSIPGKEQRASHECRGCLLRTVEQRIWPIAPPSNHSRIRGRQCSDKRGAIETQCPSTDRVGRCGVPVNNSDHSRHRNSARWRRRVLCPRPLRWDWARWRSWLGATFGPQCLTPLIHDGRVFRLASVA
jgi:hypothetical protein